ncbi:hypothetical protein GMO_08990 [Gluconobacter morbifer G707]|uniref:Uncharacterized protein n=1 Tax=Gluconobacter morbifer G707 TaxID=1088869 RepID=G6XHD3_9PROT|nr:hypothetical protein GMO_08990 [Gluconobacter morbifer G707]
MLHRPVPTSHPHEGGEEFSCVLLEKEGHDRKRLQQDIE